MAVAFTCLGLGEAFVQRREDQFVRSTTERVLREARADGRDAKVTALRDYVRTHVSHRGFPPEGRPLLRDSAASTLRTGKGWCGEATRVFVNMARAAGIPARRLYLEGSPPHVVAVVGDGSGGSLLVDSYDEPYLPETEPLSLLPRHAEFTSYSTFGGGRLLRFLPSNDVNLGDLNYLLENPHALRAGLWLLLAAATLALTAYYGYPSFNPLRPLRPTPRPHSGSESARRT